MPTGPRDRLEHASSTHDPRSFTASALDGREQVALGLLDQPHGPTTAALRMGQARREPVPTGRLDLVFRRGLLTRPLLTSLVPGAVAPFSRIRCWLTGAQSIDYA